MDDAVWEAWSRRWRDDPPSGLPLGKFEAEDSPETNPTRDAEFTLREIKRMCASPFRTDVEPGRVAIARMAIIERFAEMSLGLDVSPVSNDGPTGNWPSAESVDWWA
jgi:hypothetical protein